MSPALQTPEGVAVDGSGNVYVDNTAKQFHPRVQLGGYVSDGTYQAQSVAVSGSENTNAVGTPGYYQATLTCPGTAPVAGPRLAAGKGGNGVPAVTAA